MSKSIKPRLIWPTLKKEIRTEEIIVITGPRQVGKTTTLNWLLKQIKSDNKICFDLQNLADRELFETKNYKSIIKEIVKKGLNEHKKMYIAIDEIQLLPSLPEIVKYLYDHYSIKFFLTGSSSFYIKNKFNESMAGRKIIYEMYPLRFQEFLTFKGIDYQLTTDLELTQKFNQHAYQTLKNAYNEYIEFGGLPKIVLTKSTDRKKQLLQEIFSSYITLDVEVLADFKSSTALRKVIKILASKVGNPLNVSQIARIIGLTRVTVTNYIEFLQQTYLIRSIAVFSKSPAVKLRKAQKCYFIDTGIANINADLSGGAKFENTLCHQLSFYGKLNYFLNSSGEIDFILNQSNQTAFEVKTAPTTLDLKKLKRRSQALAINQYRLIGKNQSAQFDDYLWGGLIK